MSQVKKIKPKRLKTLILTETADKAKVIRRFLGRQYLVMSTDGFLRDLPKTKVGLDIENNFEEQYITVRGKGKLVEQIRKEALKARRIYLATNLDEEGELLAWHLCHLFGINKTSNCRLILNEMTKDSIRSMVDNAKTISINKVEMSRTRQAIERLFIYELNPLLWHEIYRGVSITRMQALILKIIYDQENALNPIQTIKTLDNQLKSEKLTFKTLQYAASKILNMQTGATSITLRQLYEGVSINGIPTGLITFYKGDVCPSSEMLTPESLKTVLTANQFLLYNFIWQHYNKQIEMPDSQGETHTSYSDYLLMEELESKGVIWSNTFSLAVCSLLKRKYITLKKDGYKPTSLGIRLLNILKQYFSTLITIKSISKIESQIQEVLNGSLNKHQVVEEFYNQLKPCLTKAYDKIGTDPAPKDPPTVVTNEICDKCGSKMIIKHSRYGLFLACQRYPECKNTKQYIEVIKQRCPKCGAHLAKRQWNKLQFFFSCENYPKCDFSTWDEPQQKSCEICGSTLFLHKFKDHSPMIYCGNENCQMRKNHPINNIIKRQKAKTKSKKSIRS